MFLFVQGVIVGPNYEPLCDDFKLASIAPFFMKGQEATEKYLHFKGYSPSYHNNRSKGRVSTLASSRFDSRSYLFTQDI